MVTRLEVVQQELDDLANEINVRQSTAKPADLGRLSAEAVLASYTAAVEAIESLKEPIKDRAEKLVTALRECDETLKSLEELAKKIQDTGHLVAAQIDESNALNSNIRKLSAELIAKVK